eukprot:6492544-Amphidinium_carterae.1
MGFSWAMLFAQKAHENILLGAGLTLEQQLVDGRRAPPLGGDVWAAYVDNCAIFSTSEERAEFWRVKLQDKLDSLGLETHDVVTATQSTDLLGHHIDGVNLTLSLKPNRFWKIRQATLGLLDRGRCTGQELSVLVGHLTFAFLLNRPLLSVFAACYVFVDKHRHRRVRMWPSVARELANAVGLLPLAYSSLRASWAEDIMVVDACMSGLAVGSRYVGTTESEFLGTYNERWRFSGERAIQPRRRVLEHLGVESAKKTSDITILESEHVELLSKDLVDHTSWQTKYKHKLDPDAAEPIHVKEAYASLSAVKHICRRRQSADKFVIFGDNMSVCLALQRGRSKDYKLLHVVRKVAAHQLALGHHYVFRWLPSEVNPVDKASRAFENGHHSASAFTKTSSAVGMQVRAEDCCRGDARFAECRNEFSQEGSGSTDGGLPQIMAGSGVNALRDLRSECQHVEGLHKKVGRVQGSRTSLVPPAGHGGFRRARFTELLRQGFQRPAPSGRWREVAGGLLPPQSTSWSEGGRGHATNGKNAGVMEPSASHRDQGGATTRGCVGNSAAAGGAGQARHGVSSPDRASGLFTAGGADAFARCRHSDASASAGEWPPVLEPSTVPFRQLAAVKDAHLRRCGALRQRGLHLLGRPARRCQAEPAGACAGMAFHSPGVARGFSKRSSGSRFGQPQVGAALAPALRSHLGQHVSAPVFGRNPAQRALGECQVTKALRTGLQGEPGFGELGQWSRGRPPEQGSQTRVRVNSRFQVKGAAWAGPKLMYVEFGVRPHLSKVSAQHGISSHFLDLHALAAVSTLWLKRIVHNQPLRVAGIGINIEELPERHFTSEVMNGIVTVCLWCERHRIPLHVIARANCKLWGHPLMSSLVAEGAYFDVFASCCLGSKWCAQIAVFALTVSAPTVPKCSCRNTGCIHVARLGGRCRVRVLPTRFWHLLFACVTDRLVAKYICQSTQGGVMGLGVYGHKE